MLPSSMSIEFIRDSTGTLILGRVGVIRYPMTRADGLQASERVDYFNLDIPEEKKAFDDACTTAWGEYRNLRKAQAPQHTDSARVRGCEAATVDALTEEYGST